MLKVEKTGAGRFLASISYFSIVVLFMSLIGACASTSSLQNAPLHAGTARTFKAGFDATLRAAREATVEAGLQIEKVTQTDDNSWMIIAKKSTSAWSFGELVRVMIVKKSAASTEVRVHTKRRVSINLEAKGDYSTAILSNIELKLRS